MTRVVVLDEEQLEALLQRAAAIGAERVIAARAGGAQPELMTASQAAVLARVAKAQVLAALRDGGLPGRRRGNRWIIRRADVVRWSLGNAG